MDSPIDLLKRLGLVFNGTKQGQAFSALCPFHNGTSFGNFGVFENGYYSCFSCGAKGSLKDLVNHITGGKSIENIDFANIQGSIKKFRAVSTEAVNSKRKFELTKFSFDWRGYPNKFLTETMGFRLLKAKECCKKTDEWVDVRRIYMPLLSSGIQVGYNARLISKYAGTNEEKDKKLCAKLINKGIPKYMLSGGSPDILLGFDDAKMDRELVLCEGQMDYLRLRSFNMNAVALLGASKKFEEATLLSMLSLFPKVVYLAFDGDTAGEDSSVEIKEKLVAAGITTKIFRVPEGFDPGDAPRSCFKRLIHDIKVNCR